MESKKYLGFVLGLVLQLNGFVHAQPSFLNENRFFSAMNYQPNAKLSHPFLALTGFQTHVIFPNLNRLNLPNSTLGLQNSSAQGIPLKTVTAANRPLLKEKPKNDSTQFLRPFRYFRMSGGLISFPTVEGYEGKYHTFPFFSVGYHFGDLLKFQINPQNTLTLSGQIYTLWTILVPMVQIGPEFYTHHQRIGFYLTRPFLLSEYSDINSLPFAFEFAQRKPYGSDGKWFEFILTTYIFPLFTPQILAFRFEMNFPLL